MVLFSTLCQAIILTILNYWEAMGRSTTYHLDIINNLSYMFQILCHIHDVLCIYPKFENVELTFGQNGSIKENDFNPTK